MNEPTTYEGDPEFERFMEEQGGKAKASIKQYRSNYTKLRRMLQKPITETSEKTAVKAITAAFDNANTQTALLNIALMCRKLYDMPFNELVIERVKLKETIDDSLRQTNQYMVLPSIEEFDDHMKYHTRNPY